jgi:hypothetical protein
VTYAVVGSAVQRDTGTQHAPQAVCKFAPSGIENRQVIESGRTRRRSLAAEAFPGVQADVMVIPTRSQKSRAIADALRNSEAEDIAIKCERTLKIRHLQVDMTDTGLRVDRRHDGQMRAKPERRENIDGPT